MKKDDKKLDPNIRLKENAVLEEKIKELENGWRRTQADFENYRKRTEEMKLDWIKEANLEMIVKILPVIDNFERANQYVPDDLKNHDWVKGVQLIEKHLNDILTVTGLQKIPAKSGDEFDPNIHEAISSEENKEIKPNHIIAVTEPGYKLGTQIIRPVKVRVSKGK